jgi:hypothetical protein
MNCELCNKEKEDEIHILLQIFRNGEKIIVNSCFPCAIGSGFYCEKHMHIHIIYPDELSYCTKCASEKMECISEKAVYTIYEKVLEQFDDTDDQQDLNQFLFEETKGIGKNEPMMLYRYIIIKALRYKEDIRTIAEELCKNKSFSYLIT